MSSKRLIPVMVIAAITVCIILIGFPLRSDRVLGNFSGRLVLATGERNLEVSGHYNLYNPVGSTARVRMMILVDGSAYEVRVRGDTRAFSGTLKLGPSLPPALEARLEVDGRVVASGLIELPDAREPRIHIIRFTSLS